MSLKFFKDMIIEDQLLAKEQQQLSKYIRLEEIIKAENAALNPRKSQRIANIKKYHDMMNAYTAYLNSLEMNNIDEKNKKN